MLTDFQSELANRLGVQPASSTATDGVPGEGEEEEGEEEEGGGEVEESVREERRPSQKKKKRRQE